MQLLHETPGARRARRSRPRSIPRRRWARRCRRRLRALADSGLERPDRADQDHARVPQHRGDVQALDGDPEPLPADRRLHGERRADRGDAARRVAPAGAHAAGRSTPSAGRDRGVVVEPSLVPPLPMLEAIVPPGAAAGGAARRDDRSRGHHLDGTGRDGRCSPTIASRSRRRSPRWRPAARRSMQFPIPPAQRRRLPGRRLPRRRARGAPGETDPRETNRLAMTLAPQITGLPMSVVRDGAGTASFTLNFRPALRAGQTCRLVLGQQEYAPQTFTAPVSLARLRRSRTRRSAITSRACASTASTARSSTARSTPPLFLEPADRRSQ